MIIAARSLSLKIITGNALEIDLKAYYPFDISVKNKVCSIKNN